jgi:uncharacterized protein YdaU (DUF1376 family)
MHYYPFHIGDYASHTRSLSQMEDLAYRRLLDEYYLHERPFPDRLEDIARQIGMREHMPEIEYVLKSFFVLKDGFYWNPRAEEEIEKQRNLVETGRLSAQKRWAKEKNREAIATPLPPHSPPIATQLDTQCLPNGNPMGTHCQPNANQEPISNIQEPKENTIAVADARQELCDKPYQPKAQVLRLNVQWTEEGFDIPSSIRAGFSTAYPAIKLDAEIAKAHAWVLSHPKNRKSNWGRFLNNWLQKAQDKAPTVTSWKDDPRFKGLA